MTKPPKKPAERGRDSRGQFFRDLDVADRDAAAADLRREGKTYEQIAAALGYTNRGSAHHAVMRAMAHIRQDAGDKLIAVEREELERLYLAALELLEADHQAVAQGRAVYDEAGQPIYDAQPKIAAINAAVKIRESYRKLLGLDQPAKQEISGGVKYEVVGVTEADLS
jgi:hypothetical protein